MFKKSLVLSLVVLICAAARGEAEQPKFAAGQRVLVVAPHPDDETLGLGGMLQRAKASGADVRVVYLTNGESNEVASIFYQKQPLLLRSDFLKSGVMRKKEALEAMAFLGLRSEELIFFGYPDGGTLNIWLKYWGLAAPFRSFFTRLSRVPYKDNFSAGHSFKGDEIVRDFERVLVSFEPTVVFVTAPFDLNPDHQAAYLYLQVALMNLRGRFAPPALYVYLVHAHQWPEPKRFLPEQPLPVPTHIDWAPHVRWNSFELTTAEVQKKSETLRKYKSQLSFKKNFLLAFARRNELYAEYPYEKIVSESEPPSAAASGDVRYRITGQELWIEIPLSTALDEMGVLSSYVFSYRRGLPFSDMPKFAFRLFGNKMFVQDGPRTFHDPGIVYRFVEDRLFIRVPLRLLKDPEILFVSTRNAKEELSLDFGAWQALEIVL